MITVPQVYCFFPEPLIDFMCTKWAIIHTYYCQGCAFYQQKISTALNPPLLLVILTLTYSAISNTIYSCVSLSSHDNWLHDNILWDMELIHCLSYHVKTSAISTDIYTGYIDGLGVDILGNKQHNIQLRLSLASHDNILWYMEMIYDNTASHTMLRSQPLVLDMYMVLVFIYSAIRNRLSLPLAITNS